MDLKYAGFKFTSLSLTLHLVFLSCFIFTFKGREDHQGPFLFFLGSILQNQDILNVSSGRNKFSAVPLDIHLETPIEQNRFTTVAKPPFAASSPENKIYLKTPFTPLVINDSHKNETNDKFDVIPRYQPLKLQNQ